MGLGSGRNVTVVANRATLTKPGHLSHEGEGSPPLAQVQLDNVLNACLPNVPPVWRALMSTLTHNVPVQRKMQAPVTLL